MILLPEGLLTDFFSPRPPGLKPKFPFSFLLLNPGMQTAKLPIGEQTCLNPTYLAVSHKGPITANPLLSEAGECQALVPCVGYVL